MPRRDSDLGRENGIDVIEPLAAAVRRDGLIILAGAGVSMLAPASLPNWRDFNRAVIDALADRVGRDTNRKTVADFLADILDRRQSERVYSPDFMAQLIEEEVGADYFRVLQVLDGQACNLNHLQIAALARTGHLRAVVTTNFDRLIERGLDQLGVTYRVFASADEFEELDAVLTAENGALPLIKAHGSADRPDSMVDTLAQRVRGRPQALNRAIAILLMRHPTLVIGFSGADLAYDPEYLGLRAAAPKARGLTVLVRAGETPLPALAELIADYGAAAATVEGLLPDVLVTLSQALNVAAPDPPSEFQASAEELQARLADHAGRWVDQLQPMTAINAFIALLDANRDNPSLLQFMLYFRRNYRTEKQTVEPQNWSLGYWRFEYRFARRLLDVGRLVHQPDDDGDSRRLLSGYPYLRMRQDEDALQRLFNLRNRGRDAFEAEAALSEFTFWCDGPGRAVAAAWQTWGAFAKAERRTAGPRAGVDMCIALARVFEWSGEYQLALAAATAGIAEARGLGDEPRRAEALVQYARALACVDKGDDAQQVLAQAHRIVDRLSLERLDAAACAAQGMLDVMASRDADAMEPLTRACDHYRRQQRQPLLLITLLDLARAAFYTGALDLARNYRREVCDLCVHLPGGQGPMLLLEGELALHDRDWTSLRAVEEDLREFCTGDSEFPWRWGLSRVERYRAALAESS
jgi:tetratricopeptide (TPR) repeat protein